MVFSIWRFLWGICCFKKFNSHSFETVFLSHVEWVHTFMNTYCEFLCLIFLLQYTLDLRKTDLRKNLDLRKIVATTDFLVQVVWFKKDFLRPNVQFKKDFFPKSGKNRDFLGFYQFFFQHLAWYSTIQFIFLKKRII